MVTAIVCVLEQPLHKEKYPAQSDFQKEIN